MDWHPVQGGSSDTLSCFMLQKPGYAPAVWASLAGEQPSYLSMNKAFIALCFGQSLPVLPPLEHHVPSTAFYRLVKATLNSNPISCLERQPLNPCQDIP